VKKLMPTREPSDGAGKASRKKSNVSGKLSGISEDGPAKRPSKDHSGGRDRQDSAGSEQARQAAPQRHRRPARPMVNHPAPHSIHHPPRLRPPSWPAPLRC